MFYWGNDFSLLHASVPVGWLNDTYVRPFVLGEKQEFLQVNNKNSTQLKVDMRLNRLKLKDSIHFLPKKVHKRQVKRCPTTT